MKIRYTGAADQRVLSPHDMLSLGVEEHEGLTWVEGQRVLDVEDDIADALLEKLPREFEQQVDPALESEYTKAELLQMAEDQGLSPRQSMTKAELAELISSNDDPIVTNQDDVTGFPTLP